MNCKMTAMEESDMLDLSDLAARFLMFSEDDFFDKNIDSMPSWDIAYILNQLNIQKIDETVYGTTILEHLPGEKIIQTYKYIKSFSERLATKIYRLLSDSKKRELLSTPVSDGLFYNMG